MTGLKQYRGRQSIPIVVVLACLCFFSFTSGHAYAQQACLKEYFSRPPAQGIALSEAEDLVQEVREAHQTIRNIHVVECPFKFPGKVVAYQAVGLQGVRDGEYIVYDETWMREVVGSDLQLAFIIFAHEVGHFVNGDFGSGGNNLPRPEQELAADRFAACAVARTGRSWDALETLLERMRAETSNELYKDRFTSIAEAKKGFEACGGGSGKPKENEGYITLGVYKGGAWTDWTLDGGDKVSPSALSGTSQTVGGKTDGVNLRALRNGDSLLLDTLRSGEVVEVLEVFYHAEGRLWARVRVVR